MRNLSVIACNETDGFYYPGFVSQSLEYDTISVRFYDIKPNKVARDEVIHIGGAVPCPELQLGDYALVRVMCRTTRAEYYVPAVVVVLPRGHAYDTKFYTLQLYNGRFVEKLRRNIVKIGPEKFKAIFKYIAELRYGHLARSVTLESLDSNREPPLQLKQSYSSSSHLELYPDKTDRINIFRLYDGSRERSRKPKQRPTKRRLKHVWKLIAENESNFKETRFISKSEVTHQKKDYDGRKDTSQKSDRTSEGMVTPHVTSYSDDTITGSEYAKKEALAASCDTLRSVETIISETSGSRKVSARSETPKQNQPRKKTSENHKKKDDKLQFQKKNGQSSESLDKSSRTSSRTSSVISRTFTPHRDLQTGQEILARWSDDGWYYVGVILKPDGDDRYYVGDSTGYIESILLEDIIVDMDNNFSVIQPSDHVIALHPNYVFSYAPAIVREVYNPGVKVVFFDKTQQKLPYSEIYKVKATKYKKDTKYIKACEHKRTNSVVIARDDKTGIYKTCEIVCPEGVGQKFIVKWPSGELSSQAGNHIFPVEMRKASDQKIDWQYVLAPLDESMSSYLPAEVIQTKPFRAKIFNQSRLTECCIHQCFWLNEAYYTNAVNFFINKAQNDRHNTA